jgi:hypothetical protein
MTADDRTFGLSRWEKIRIEAARLAVELIGYKHRCGDEANRQFHEFADPIEAWLLQADVDAEARRSNSESGKLADDVVAKARGTPTLPVMSFAPYGGGCDGWPTAGGGGSGGGRIAAALDVVQFAWLEQHLAKRGFSISLEMSRQDLIRAYYTDVNGGVFPDFPTIGDAPTVDGEIASSDPGGMGNLWRWDEMAVNPITKGKGIWRIIDALPGHRIENGKIKWAPGLWPPPETEAETKQSA